MTKAATSRVFTDADVMVALRATSHGGRAFHIGNRLGVHDNVGLRRITRRLKALERDGKVARSARYSVENSFYWQVPGVHDDAGI